MTRLRARVRVMTSVHDRIVVSRPVDWLARRVTARGPEYEPAARGWEPGAFSRVEVPFETRDARGRVHKLAGRRSGDLFVLGRLPATENVKTMGYDWVCRCSCGNYVLARARHIRHQSVRMCGECETTMKRAGHNLPTRVKKP